ncbi:MAG: SRPBCC family protein [Candidatus Marinimicrobia bacterium]|nr:SRPBCC family protein [Candidatus Neomarinimicrobiota bacterium]
MTTFEVSIIINQPTDIVVKALMNPDNFPYWQKDLEKFEVIERKPGEVGSIGHLHYSQKGKSYIMEDILIFCEPGSKYISQVTSDAITAQVETTLNALGNKTEMVVKWTGKGKTLLLRLLLPLLRGKMIRQSRVELETFKQLIETKGYTFVA